jgi:hypothetical protein
VYVEPNVRQTLRKPKSFIKTKRIPTQNDSNITLGKVKNFDKTISRAKNESYSYWESEITDVRLRQNKPSNRSIFVAQRLRRRLCCC